MKIIKSMFLISLFNFMIVLSIVLAFKKTSIPMATITVSPQATVTAAPQQMMEPMMNNRCIITVDGVKYDISQYQYQHSGGDIFQCGTDMSTVFHNRHSNRFLKKMQQYRI